MLTDTDGLRNPAGVTEDIEHRLLESDLTLQVGMLHDKLATEQMRGADPYSSTMSLPVLDGGLDMESSDSLMICLAIAGLLLLPQFL